MPAAPVRARARVVTALLVLLPLLAACSGDDGDSDVTRRDTTPPKGDVTFEVGTVTVHGIGAATELDKETTTQIVKAVDRYVNVAMVQPLLERKPAKGLERLFAPTVAERVAGKGPDRDALADERVGPATTDLRTSATPIVIDALTAADGAPLLVAARVRVQVSTTTDRGPVTIARRVELTFQPAPDGSWLISAYRVVAKRETPGTGATTTTAEAS